jgi:hypothetical protein
MIRLIALPFVLVLLTGAQCSKAEIEKYSALVTNPPVQFVALEQESKRAWEEGVVAEVVPEPPVYERVCWIEWHRAGTMAVEVCEDRLVLP